MNWNGTAIMSRSGMIMLGAILLFLGALTALDFRDAFLGAPWFLLAVTLTALALVVTGIAFRVRTDGRGLRVRSVMGWPSTRLALDDIEKVEVVRIRPLLDFGGWGWRLGADGRRGVVLRRGEALQITHVNDTVFVVTVDGAAEAAAVLGGLRKASDSEGVTR